MRRTIMLLLLLLPFCGLAQKKQGQERLDSLESALRTLNDDTDKIKLIQLLAYAYSSVNTQKAIDYATKGLALAQNISSRKGEAMAYNNLGLIYTNMAEFPEALNNFYKAMNIAEEIDDKEIAKSCVGNIGNIYFAQNNYPKALEFYNKALKLSREVGNQSSAIVSIGNIGNVYLAQGQVQQALGYLQQAASLAEQSGDAHVLMDELSTIGAVYLKLKNYRSALSYMFRSLRLATDDADKHSLSVNMANIGEVYLDIASDTAVVPPFDTMIPAGKKAALEKAVTYLNGGIAIASEIGFKQGLVEFYETLARAYAAQGNYKDAFTISGLGSALKDSLFSAENAEKFASLENNRTLQLKDKDIQLAKLALAKKRTESIYLIIGIILLLLLSLFLFRVYRNQQHLTKLVSTEKKRSEDLLRNILPAEVAEELKENGRSVAKQFDNTSVLFTDFVDFTGLAEKLSPQQLVMELHECFTAFDAIIERNGLEKIKTIGDAYMAACGIPMPDPDHAINTVQAALEILEFIEERKKQKSPIEIRIGINSGPVVAGIVGVKKFAYDIWGDTVNTAARMEQRSEPGRINISRQTYDLVWQHYKCTYRGALPAKNKGEVEMYYVEPAQTKRNTNPTF